MSHTVIDNPTMAGLLACPEPGIYDVPAELYHRWRGASAHRLNTLYNGSPAHVMEEMLNRPEPTPAMMFGTAVHTALLQPELLAQTILVADQCAAVTGKGERCASIGKFRSPCGEWFCGTHNKALKHPAAAGIILSREDFDRAQLIAEAVLRHPYARELVAASKDEIEKSITFIDEASGVKCKMRPDMIAAGLDALVDLKTTDCAKAEAFQYTIRDYGYHRQSAIYRRGVKSSGVKGGDFAFIAAEKKPPFCVAVFHLEPQWLRLGALEVNELLEWWATCEQSGVWPGYPDGIEMIGQSSWDRKQGRDKYGDSLDKDPEAN